MHLRWIYQGFLKAIEVATICETNTLKYIGSSSTVRYTRDYRLCMRRALRAGHLDNYAEDAAVEALHIFRPHHHRGIST